MTLQLVGAVHLARLMQAERVRDLDTSWLLFGPVDEPAIEDEAPAPFRYAAE